MFKCNNSLYGEKISRRCLDEAMYLIVMGCTIRDVVKITGTSRGTVHSDLRDRLPNVNPVLSVKVNEILEKNKLERSLRGGEATKRKYLS